MFKKRGLSEIIGLVIIIGLTVIISVVVYIYFTSIKIIPSETCPDEVSFKINEARYVERTKYNYAGNDPRSYLIPSYDFPLNEYFTLNPSNISTGSNFAKTNTETLTLNLTNTGFYSIKGVYVRIKVNSDQKEETISMFNFTEGKEIYFDNTLEPGESEKIKILKENIDKREAKKWISSLGNEWWDYDIDSLIVTPIIDLKENEKIKQVACSNSKLKLDKILKLKRPSRENGGSDMYQRTPFDTCSDLGLTMYTSLNTNNMQNMNDYNSNFLSNKLDKNNGDCKELSEHISSEIPYPMLDLFRVAKNNSIACIENQRSFFSTLSSEWFTDPQLFCLNGYFYEVYPDQVDASGNLIWSFRNLFYGNPGDSSSEDKVADLIPGTIIGDYIADPDYENGYFYKIEGYT